MSRCWIWILLLKKILKKRGRVYDDQKVVKLRDYISIKNQHGSNPLFMDPILLDVTFIFQIPAYWTRDRKNKALNKPCDNRIDLDNCIKYLADVCHGIIYTDDRIITSIQADKIYGTHAKTLFTFTKL